MRGKWAGLLALLLSLALAPGFGQDQPADPPAGDPAQPQDKADQPKADGDQGVGGDAAEQPKDDGQPATDDQPPGDQPKDGEQPAAGPKSDEGTPPPPPGPGETPLEPDSLVEPAPPPERRRAIIRALEPGSRIKTGPDRSVVARGKLQMIIPDDEVIVYCTAVDYSGETQGIATVTGDLRIETGKLVEKDGRTTIPSPENVITGDIGYVFTKEKRAVVDGHVVIVHTPQEAAPADANEVEEAKYDVTTVYCDRLTYWYRKGDRKAVLQPRLPNTQIRFAQKTRNGTADKATFYDFEKGQTETGDVLDLIGHVYAEDDKGQKLRAEVLRLYVEREMLDGYNIQELVINLEREQRSPNEPGGPPARPGGAEGAPPAGDGGPPPPGGGDGGDAAQPPADGGDQAQPPAGGDQAEPPADGGDQPAGNG